MRISIVLILVLILGSGSQNPPSSPTVAAHIRDLIDTLPTDSFLRLELQGGARGDGIHYAWMDSMRHQAVKRVVAEVHIHFSRNGKPKEMKTVRVLYYSDYDATSVQITDPNRLQRIRVSGLEEQLERIAVERAAHGSWVDIPRPKPHPFVGRTSVELFDDEWLPLRPPLFGADPSQATPP